METEAELLREAKCRNVYTEPSLLSTCAEPHPECTITDTVATGLYRKKETTFIQWPIIEGLAKKSPIGGKK